MAKSTYKTVGEVTREILRRSRFGVQEDVGARYHIVAQAVKQTGVGNETTKHVFVLYKLAAGGAAGHTKIGEYPTRAAAEDAVKAKGGIVESVEDEILEGLNLKKVEKDNPKLYAAIQAALERDKKKDEEKKKEVKEEGGAGDIGTPELTQKLVDDTPGQVNPLKEKLAKVIEARLARIREQNMPVAPPRGPDDPTAKPGRADFDRRRHNWRAQVMRKIIDEESVPRRNRGKLNQGVFLEFLKKNSPATFDRVIDSIGEKEGK